MATITPSQPEVCLKCTLGKLVKTSQWERIWQWRKHSLTSSPRSMLGAYCSEAVVERELTLYVLEYFGEDLRKLRDSMKQIGQRAMKQQ